MTPTAGTSTEAHQLADLAAVAVLGAVLTPSRVVHGGPTVCLVRRATGLPCPACGLTRSWNAAARFRVRDSLAYHPLGPLTLVLALLVAGDSGRRTSPDGKASRLAVAAMSAAWLAVWLARVRAARGAGR